MSSFPPYSAEWNATCGQRVATVRITQPVGQPYLNFSLFLCILAAIIIPFGLVVFFIGRSKWTYVRKRNLPAVITCAIGAALGIFVGPVMDVIGRENVSCDLAMWARTFAIVLVCVPIVYMLNFFHAQLLWSKILATISFNKLQEVLNEANEQADRTHQNSRKSIFRSNNNRIADTPRSQPSRDDEVASEKGSVHTSPTRLDSGASSFDDSAFAQAMAKRSTKFKLLVLILPFVPPLILCLVLQFTLPYYGHGCVGCVDEPFFIAVLLATTSIIVSNVFWTAYKLKDATDSLGILKDLRLSVVGAVVIGMPGFVGLLIDVLVGKPYDSGVFSFDWLIALGILWYYVIQVINPVFTAYTNSRRVGGNNKVDFKSLLANLQFQKIFGEHLVSEFSIENLKFFNQVNNFRDHYAGFKTSKQANLVALQTYETFIRPGSVLEVNISSFERERLMAEFQSLVAGDGLDVIQIEKTIFDKAQAEIIALMEKDPFRRFQLTKTFQEFASQNLIVNPASNMLVVASGAGMAA